MGDHATNIAETIYYMVEGRPLPDDLDANPAPPIK
jgi:phosphate uptake regulator